MRGDRRTPNAATPHRCIRKSARLAVLPFAPLNPLELLGEANDLLCRRVRSMSEAVARMRKMPKSVNWSRIEMRLAVMKSAMTGREWRQALRVLRCAAGPRAGKRDEGRPVCPVSASASRQSGHNIRTAAGGPVSISGTEFKVGRLRSVLPV